MGGRGIAFCEALPRGRFFGGLGTTRDASKEAFRKTLWNYNYYPQLAFYRFALEYAGAGKERACYRLSETTLKAGERQLEDLLRLYGKCWRTGAWPCYPEEMQSQELPHGAWDKL